MPILTIPKTYANNTVLNESDLDNIKNAIETFINTTKLDSTNIQISAIADSVGVAMTSTGANAIASAMTSTGANSILGTITTTEGYRLQGNGSSVGAYAAPNYVLGSSEISLSLGSASSYTDITNATVTITARNRPMMLILQSNDASTAGNTGCLRVINGDASVKLVKDGVDVNKQHFSSESVSTTQNFPASDLCFIDANAGTGSKVYKLQYLAHNGTLSIIKCKLLAIEL